MENRTTGLTPDGNAPLFPCGDFPRRGKFALRSALGIISTSMHSTAKSSPSGGSGALAPKGVHFQRPQGGLLVFPRPPGRLYGFRCQRQHIYSSPPKAAIPQPSAAQPMSNLRTFGAKAPSILRTFFSLASGNTAHLPYDNFHAFPPTGIYRPMSHYLRVLRAFCRECASRPKLALSLPIEGPSF